MTATGSELSNYLQDIGNEGSGGISRFWLFLLVIVIWIAIVIYLTKGEELRKFIRNMFRNVENDPQPENSSVSSGIVFDIDNKQILKMDMNPIQDSSLDVFVPKYDNGKSSNDEFHSEVYTPTPKDYGLTNGNNGNNQRAVNGKNENGANGNSDIVTDVNAVVNMIVRADSKGVFDYFRKVKDRGISSENFAESIILEIDTAYRTRLSGETNRHNIVLSQIISHWSNEKIERIISAFLSVVEQNYADKNIGARVALMRVMKIQ